VKIMGTLLQDIRHGLRALRKSPGLTAIVAITIAIGVGANTAVFSLVNGFLIGRIGCQLYSGAPRHQGRPDGGAPLRVKRIL